MRYPASRWFFVLVLGGLPLTASAEMTGNPFMGTSAALEQLKEQYRVAQLRAKLKSQELAEAKTDSQLQLLPYQLKTEIAKQNAEVRAALPPPPPPKPAPPKPEKKSKPTPEKAPAPAPAPQPSLTGIVQVGQQTLAMLSMGGESYTLGVGQAIRGYTVAHIQAEGVILNGGPTGRMVLHAPQTLGRMANPPSPPVTDTALIAAVAPSVQAPTPGSRIPDVSQLRRQLNIKSSLPADIPPPPPLP